MSHAGSARDAKTHRGCRMVPSTCRFSFQERSVGDDGQLAYDRNRNLGADGMLVLVNGVAWPRMSVYGRRYRFRIVMVPTRPPIAWP